MPVLKKRTSRRSRNKDSTRPIRRAKTKVLSQQEASQYNDADKEWAAREILAESSNQYLIDWDSDSETGEKYSPTWEPKQNASRTLIRRWKEDRISKNSSVAEPSQATYPYSSIAQHNNFSAKKISCSSFSRHNSCREDCRNFQIGDRESSVWPENSLRRQSQEHTVNLTEGSTPQNTDLRNTFSNCTAAVDSEPHCSDSENIRESILLEPYYSYVQPSTITVVPAGRGADLCSHIEEAREIALTDQLTEVASTCCVEDSADQSTKRSGKDGQSSILITEQSKASKDLTLNQHLKSVISCSLQGEIGEVSESWQEKNSQKLIVSSGSVKAYEAKLLPGRERKRDQPSVSYSHNPLSVEVLGTEEQDSSEEILESTYSDIEPVTPVTSNFYSFATDLGQPGNNYSLHQHPQNLWSAEDTAPLEHSTKEPFADLSSSDISGSTIEQCLSSSIPNTSATTSPRTLGEEEEEEEEELKSSVYNDQPASTSSGLFLNTSRSFENSSIPSVITALSASLENLTQSHCFQLDSQPSQRTSLNFPSQVKLASISEQRDRFASTFETLPALASSYVAPEPEKINSYGGPASEGPIAFSTVETSEVHHKRPTFDQASGPGKPDYLPTFGDRSNVLVLAPTVIPGIWSAAPSSDTEDISTPFETQIPISIGSQHNHGPDLGIIKDNQKIACWEEYILRKFGIHSPDGQSHHQKRVHNLLKVLTDSEELPAWKTDALILLFIARNSDLQKSCSDNIVSLAEELYDITRSTSGKPTSQEEGYIATDSLTLRHEHYDLLRQKYKFFPALERKNQDLLDSPLLQRSKQRRRNRTSPNIGTKDKEFLWNSEDKSIQFNSSNIENSEMADAAVTALLSEPSLAEEEYIFPLPMHGPTAEQYRNIIPYYNTHIKRFVSKNRHHVKHEFRPVKRLLDHLHNITYHLDLEDDGALTREKISKSTQAKWDENCSSKFRALGVIFNELKDKEFHAVIVVRSGRPTAILENWLASKGIQFKKPGLEEETTTANKFVEGCLSVSIVTEHANDISGKICGIDAIFALDYSFSMDREKLTSLQLRSKISNRLAPVITFVIFASQEHILRHIPAALTEIEQLQILASQVVNQRLAAGTLPSGVPELTESALVISKWLLWKTKHSPMHISEGNTITWPLQPIGKLQNSIKPQTFQLDSSSEIMRHTLKRSNDLNDEDEYSKRLRVSSQPGFMHEKDGSTMHDSVTNIASSQFNQTSELQLVQSSHKSSKIGQSISVEIRLLKKQLQLADEKIKDYESVVEDLHMRSEQQRVEMAKLQEENKQLGLASERHRTSNIELAKAVDEAHSQTQMLQDQEEQIGKQVAEQEVWGVAKAEERIIELKGEKEKLEKKVREQDKELNFIRERYQYASDVAVKSTEQVTSLSNLLQVAQRQASGEASRLKQMHLSSYTSRLENECKSLKAVNENLTELLRRKDDELGTLRTRATWGNRATSIPRSPRFGPSGSVSGTGSPPTPKSFHPLRTLQD